MGFQGKGDLSVWSLTSGRPCIRQITHLTLFTKEEQLIFFYMAIQLSIVYTSLSTTSRITVLFIRNLMNPAKGNTSLLLLSLLLVCPICTSLDCITPDQYLKDGDGQLQLSTSTSFLILKSVHNSLIINATSYINFNVYNQAII